MDIARPEPRPSRRAGRKTERSSVLMVYIIFTRGENTKQTMETLTFRLSRKFTTNKEGEKVLEMAFGTYWEFIISGKPLQEILDIEQSDYTSVLPVKQSAHRDNTFGPSLDTIISRILAHPTDRVMLYHCGSCADEGCGFFTVKIEEVGNRIIWRDFAYSDSLREDALSEEDLEIDNNIPAFEFDRDAYIQAFEQLRHS